jgi:hypothetical protein
MCTLTNDGPVCLPCLVSNTKCSMATDNPTIYSERYRLWEKRYASLNDRGRELQRLFEMREAEILVLNERMEQCVEVMADLHERWDICEKKFAGITLE